MPMSKLLIPFTLCLALLLSACRPSAPSQSMPCNRLPQITPDFVDVTIPINLCPPNFGLNEAGSRVVARLSTNDFSYTYGQGKQILIDPTEWEQLKQSAIGNDIQVELWSEQPEGWIAYQPFSIHVAPDSIDRYISYRLIPPSYVSYEELIIEQRDLSSFQTREIYSNMLVNTEQKGQCINCHSYQNYNSTGRFLFHARQAWGGTLLVDGEQIRKVDLKHPGGISAGVYPAWHPSDNLIAFSTNKTAQVFHSLDTAKIEVFDSASDLILYDPVTDQVSSISSLTDQLETFPTWSPDGQWLYFSSAQVPFDTLALNLSQEAVKDYQLVRYDLYRKPFDRTTHQFGPTQLVYRASADSLSATLPRISPDGRYLVAALGPYGCFHVWHPQADIMLLDLHALADSTAQPQLLDPINSDQSESYPTFSSNGRWLMCASRRDDGNYTRPYIAYFDRQGRCHKPFQVPQQSPAHYQLSFKSYNRPEFMVAPVQVSPKDIARVVVSN